MSSYEKDIILNMYDVMFENNLLINLKKLELLNLLKLKQMLIIKRTDINNDSNHSIFMQLINKN